MQNNISKVSIEQCCGCGACYNKCPIGAITMQENQEGFLAPVIDETKCTNCGLCAKSCPSLNVQYKNNPKPECYAAMADDAIRMKSSSGGVFTLLAEYILDKGGYVCGAAFRKDWSVHHIIVDNKEDLANLRGSKYVQSDTEDCYKRIKVLLDNDKYVLFSGCPCQVAGLYNFLGKEYEKLYTMDLICHGTPSQKVWKKYLDENFDTQAIKKIDFRDKSVYGWSTTMNLYFNDDREDFHKLPEEDPYYRGFLPCLILNKHCGICKYTKLPRQGDISLGDWWGIDNFQVGLNDGKGTSQVLLNSTKGLAIYNDISEKLKINFNIGLDTTLKSINKTIYQPFSTHPKRKSFFENLDKLSIYKNISQSLDNKYDICLLTTFFARNYGAILVAYAVNKLLRNMNYSVLMLQKPDFVWKGYPIKDTIPTEFAKKHYDLSRVYYDNEDLISINQQVDIFVTGSDQIFNPKLHLDFIFLEFVRNFKKKVAFGTSFGHDEFPVSEKEFYKKKYLLSQFDYVALREKGENLSKIFGNEMEEVIDPTLVLPISVFHNIEIPLETQITRPYLLTYMLDHNSTKVELVKYIAEKLNLDIINIKNLEPREQVDVGLFYPDEEIIPEKFLYLYHNASFVVTDSFHGTCFSVKYNKPFVSLVNSHRGKLRYKLFENLGLGYRLVENVSDIYNNDDLLKSFDYTDINKQIEEKAEFAITWLKNALETPVSKNNDYENYIDIIQKDLQCRTQRANNELAALRRQVEMLYNKDTIYKRYYRYKLLSKILFGKKRKHYKEKAWLFHQKVREIRNFGGGGA